MLNANDIFHELAKERESKSKEMKTYSKKKGPTKPVFKFFVNLNETGEYQPNMETTNASTK